MRDSANIVIIGAGIVGCATAYHLAELGWRDIVVVDQGPLFETGGSTSHAPGLVFQTSGSRMLTRLARYTVDLLNRLDLDGEPCFHRVGSVEVAETPERMTDLSRKLGFANSFGVEGARILTPEEVAALNPLVNTDMIEGGLFVPGDGVAKAVRASEAMARRAEATGAATFIGRAGVTGFEIADGRLLAVETEQGRIETGQAVICCGMWGPKVAQLAGLSIPLTPVEHQLARSTPIAGLSADAGRECVHPLLRHQDRDLYFRQVGDCYMIGSYSHEPRLVEPENLATDYIDGVMPSIMPWTEEDFQGPFEDACALVPALADLDYPYRINGMFSFTTDGAPVIGESAIKGLWVGEAVWVTHSAGVGKVLAEWIALGEPSMDIHDADINRFHAHHHGRRYVRARGAQNYREVYDIIHPKQQMAHPRPLRRAPFFARMQAEEGHCFEAMGWERPQWYEANAELLTQRNLPGRDGWAARYWSPIEGAEAVTTRDKVAMYDLSPFTKISVEGPGAVSYMQWLCTNNVDQPIGKVVYTSMVTQSGGIKCDLTVTRTGQQRFLVLTGAGAGMHDLAWIRDNAPADGSVHVADLTSAFCTIGLWGPHARDVLASVTPDDDVSNEGFPFYRAKNLTIGHVPAFALRVSFVGELGWEIYAPSEFGLTLWDTLWEAGQPYGIIAAGGGAFDALRVEKGFRMWGSDIHTDYNPFEAGLGWAVKFKKGDFLGRDALLRIKEQGITRKLCCMTLDDPEAAALGNEPIWQNGSIVGYVTSANYGYSVGKWIAFGYLPIELAEPGREVDIEYFGAHQRAHVVQDPVFDPGGDRMKA